MPLLVTLGSASTHCSGRTDLRGCTLAQTLPCKRTIVARGIRKLQSYILRQSLGQLSTPTTPVSILSSHAVEKIENYIDNLDNLESGGIVE